MAVSRIRVAGRRRNGCCGGSAGEQGKTVVRGAGHLVRGRDDAEGHVSDGELVGTHFLRGETRCSFPVRQSPVPPLSPKTASNWLFRTNRSRPPRESMPEKVKASAFPAARPRDRGAVLLYEAQLERKRRCPRLLGPRIALRDVGRRISRPAERAPPSRALRLPGRPSRRALSAQVGELADADAVRPIRAGSAAGALASARVLELALGKIQPRAVCGKKRTGQASSLVPRPSHRSRRNTPSRQESNLNAQAYQVPAGEPIYRLQTLRAEQA